MFDNKWDVARAFGSSEFGETMKKDTDAIFTYGIALEKSYWTQADAWDEYMSHASAGAQEYVKKLQDSTDDIKLLAASYDSYMRKTQLGKSVDGSFTGAINAIRLYNSGLKTAGLTQKEFHEAIAETNPELDAYITKMEADGKKPTEWGYIIQTNRARLATTGLAVAATAIPIIVNSIAKSGASAAESVGALATAIGAASIALGVFNAVKAAGNPFALISLGISSLVAGIGAFSTAEAKQQEEWQQNIDAMNEAASSAAKLEEAYANVTKYYNALQNGEDVGDDFKNAVADLNKELGDNKVQFDEAKESATGYAKALAEGTKESLIEMAIKASEARESPSKKIMSLGKPYLSQVMADLGLILPSWKEDGTEKWFARASVGSNIDDASEAVLQSKLKEYYSGGKIGVKWGATEETTMGNLSDYYGALIEARNELYTKGLTESSAYKSITVEVDKYKEVVQEAVSATYQEAKLQYEIANGIPTTKEEYDGLTASLRDAAAATGSQYLQEQMLAEAYNEFIGIISDLVPTITKGDGAARVVAKSAGEYLDEVQEGYDGLSEAMKQFAEDGYLSADSLSTLYNLQKENKLGGLDLANVIERTAHGYVIAADSLEQYVDQLIAANSNYTEFATVQDRQTAIDNLMNLRAVLLTLQRTQAAAAASNRSKAAKEALEAQKDALNDQIDKYKKLIELRKKLLQTYENEQKYQRELNKKQQNLANLQTQLSVSTLDTSAAGIARTRELSNQVTEAQDALDDYTLEHAVQQIETDLDEQYGEYENFIEGKMAAIEKAIKDLDNTAKASVDMSWIDGALSDADRLLEELRRQLDSSGAMIEDKFNEVIEKMHGTPSEVKVKGKGSLPSFTVSQMYHSGGVVGGEALKHNEEFAKLLKGEFVSTPAQMQKFMNDTLPRMVTYAGRSNEFNAPLITINCDNVTSEAMPKLKEVVNEAVEKIKQELNSGMSRAGYKGTVQKLLV